MFKAISFVGSTAFARLYIFKGTKQKFGEARPSAGTTKGSAHGRSPRMQILI
jgi:hypothetical protein